MILTKIGLAWLIPDTPLWVEERRDALRRQGLELQTHMKSKRKQTGDQSKPSQGGGRQQSGAASSKDAVIQRLRTDNARLHIEALKTDSSQASQVVAEAVANALKQERAAHVDAMRAKQAEWQDAHRKEVEDLRQQLQAVKAHVQVTDALTET